jgi:hypothetical protein
VSSMSKPWQGTDHRSASTGPGQVACGRRALPEDQRFGTVFVFRQGSPLDVQDLRNIAVCSAAAVIVLADSGRCALTSSGKSVPQTISECVAAAPINAT